jgi:L-rhamnose isomerase
MLNMVDLEGFWPSRMLEVKKTNFTFEMGLWSLSHRLFAKALLTDVRSLVREVRIQWGEADPLTFYRSEKIREKLIAKRGKNA